MRGDDVFVEIPPYRADIMHPWDIIEDVAIGYGFENVPPELSKTATLGSIHPSELLKGRMREVMTGLGYMEVMPFTLTNERQHFELMQRQVSDKVTYVTHPISEDHTMLRTTLLPGLLEILSLNRHRELPQRIFEVSDVVLERQNSLHLAAASASAHSNFAQIYAALSAVMRERQIGFEVVESSDPAFLAGRRAHVLIGGEAAGVFGELHPDVILNFGMDQPVVAFELRL
ncbi:MAG TPA: hypothetical protein HA257_03095 [Candidatus Methanoperedenaceae archaeon]|nr:hypothetical protein [Candidatus Methanoperedenaceae archaeon]